MHYEKPDIWSPLFGDAYLCDHPVYNQCTLFKEGDLGLAVIQQRFAVKTKHTWWSTIDPWLANDIYTNPNFPAIFKLKAGTKSQDGLYPTICVRQLMRMLGMPPLEKQPWETRF